MTVASVGILGTGSAVPSRVLTNRELETMVDTSDEWITSRTGIKERRIAAPGQNSSDLAYEAALHALESAHILPEHIGLIICATVTPDMAFPATACLVQTKLGLEHIPAFDLSAGCSGFSYALEVGSKMALTGYEYVLVIGVDVLSRVTDYEDRSTCILFGDGAGAAVLGPVEEGFGILGSEIGADGRGASLLQLPAGGCKRPASQETVAERQHYIKMAGSDVFKFAVRVITDSAKRVLAKTGLHTDDVKWFVPHQANIRIIQAAASRLQVPEDRFFVNVDRYGNTSAASIGIALDELSRSGKLHHGDVVLLVGFGAGLTWSSIIFRWCHGGRNCERP